MQENGEVSKKSPQVFAERVEEGKIRNIFLRKKRLYFETKDLPLAADKTSTFPFPATMRRPYSSDLWDIFS